MERSVIFHAELDPERILDVDRMGRNSQQVFVRIRDKAMDKVIFNQWLQGIFGNPVNLDGTVDVKLYSKSP